MGIIVITHEEQVIRITVVAEVLPRGKGGYPFAKSTFHPSLGQIGAKTLYINIIAIDANLQGHGDGRLYQIVLFIIAILRSLKDIVSKLQTLWNLHYFRFLNLTWGHDKIIKKGVPVQLIGLTIGYDAILCAQHTGLLIISQDDVAKRIHGGVVIHGYLIRT